MVGPCWCISGLPLKPRDACSGGGGVVMLNACGIGGEVVFWRISRAAADRLLTIICL